MRTTHAKSPCSDECRSAAVMYTGTRVISMADTLKCDDGTGGIPVPLAAAGSTMLTHQRLKPPPGLRSHNVVASYLYG